MKKILVLYYSAYGRVETLAAAVAQGAASIPGTEVTVKRVPETVTPEVARRRGFKVNQTANVAEPSQLADYDAIIFGTPTRSGNMAAQMRNFLDSAGTLYFSNTLLGKFASVFTSTGTGTGQEMMITSFWRNLARHGMVIVGLPYAAAQLCDIATAHSCSSGSAAPMFALSVERTAGDDEELALAKLQGRHVAALISKQRDCIEGEPQTPGMPGIELSA